MQQELEALLAVQADDLEIHGLEERLAALQPRLKELDQRRTRIANELERAQVLVTAEEKKQAHLREKITEHKALIDRNQTQMDAVKTMRQATAAVAQMEEARRIVATEESELVAINRRLLRRARPSSRTRAPRWPRNRRRLTASWRRLAPSAMPKRNTCRCRCSASTTRSASGGVRRPRGP